jgi:hypothetical protein
MEPDMTDPAEALIADLVEWIARRPRSYDDVMEAWRSSCPRLTIWEDALDRGLVAHEQVVGADAQVNVTARGRVFLKELGRLPEAT